MQSGFTIIELMITVAIVGIVTSFAMPSYKYAIDNNNIKDVATTYHLSMLFTRSEAIKRNASITIEQNGDEGWDVKVGGTILKNEVNVTTGLTIECNTDSDSAAETCPGTITYNRTGRPTSYIEYRIFKADNTKVPMRCVSVSLSGRPRVVTDSDRVTSDGCG